MQDRHMYTYTVQHVPFGHTKVEENVVGDGGGGDSGWLSRR